MPVDKRNNRKGTAETKGNIRLNCNDAKAFIYEGITPFDLCDYHEIDEQFMQ